MKMPKTKKWDKQQIAARYLKYLTKVDSAPFWVYQFTGKQDFSEQQFRKCFDDIDQLDQFIWEGFYDRTINILQDDPQYHTYSAHEKLLSFYYTLLEVLNQYPESCRLILRKAHLPLLLPRFLSKFKRKYLAFVAGIVDEGIREHLIADRMFLSQYYKDGLWLQCFFVLHFWRQDSSAEGTQTDAAIEKAVNLSFQLMGSNAADSIIGFGQFLFQSWRSK